MIKINKRIFIKYNIVLTGFLLYLLILSGCTSTAEQAPDVKDIQVQLHTQRLDFDLNALDKNKLPEGLKSLAPQYPNFLNFYLDTVMGLQVLGNYSDTNRAITEGLKSFLTYKDYAALFDSVKVHYPNTDAVNAQLSKGFQYLKYYYPKYEVPNIIYFISGLMNWGVVSYERQIGIGLDMFLGPQYPFYAAVGQPAYMYINFREASIAPSVFATIYNDFHPFEDENQSLLAMMLQKGKQQYFVEKMLPMISLEDRIGYTQAQVEWCKKNEAMIYNFFLNQNLMFEKNWQKMRRYVVYGPNSSGMPAESPGNIGTWLGLQMVKAYVKQHPEVNLEQLFKTTNDQQFLKDAKYKPR